MALQPVSPIQGAPVGGQEPFPSSTQAPPAPVQAAARERRGQPADQVAVSPEGRERARQAQQLQEDRRAGDTRSEFDRRQQETQALANQSALGEARRESAIATRTTNGLDVTA